MYFFRHGLGYMKGNERQEVFMSESFGEQYFLFIWITVVLQIVA